MHYYDLVDPVTLTQEPSKGGLAREPSFMYDSTVEAFNTKGTCVDDSLDDSMEISVIGQILDSSKDDSELDNLILQETPSNEYQAEKLEFVSVEVDNHSQDSRKEFIIPSSGVAIPSSSNRRLSTISVEEGSKISSTPEGEKYFMKREESFVSKVAKGEIENLAVEVGDYFSLEHSASQSSLSVRPFVISPEAEIVVDNLGSQSNLTVKPVEKLAQNYQGSSYEHLYDSVIKVDVDGKETPISQANILEKLGDTFVAPLEIPDYFTSFEELYLRSTDEEDTTSDAAAQSALGERWSAPVGSVEPPILNASEFSTRLQPLKAKIDSHWDEFDVLMSTETITGGQRMCEDLLLSTNHVSSNLCVLKPTIIRL